MNRDSKKIAQKTGAIFLMVGIGCITFTCGSAVQKVISRTDEQPAVETSVVETTENEPLARITIVDSAVYYDVPLSHNVQDYIRWQCNNFDVPMSLVLGVMNTESNFNNNAVSNTNDVGIMQINLSNLSWLATDLGVADLSDLQQNITCGIYMLRLALSNNNGNATMALMEYHYGRSGAMKFWNAGVYCSTYSTRVFISAGVYENV